MKNTIERALEKQRQLEAESEQQQLLKEQAQSSTTIQVNESESVNQADQPQVKVPPAPQPVKAEARVAAQKSATDKPEISIDINRLDEMGMVTPTESFSTIKEEYRYIKRPLLNNAFGENANVLKHGNLIMVSSSFPSEGKTFTAINLALSIAMEQDRKVLLVDADVINPNVCNRLGIQEKTGLLDYLKGKASVQDIIHNTSISNLKLITAGNKSHHSNELLASEKMTTLMSELSNRYQDRICIFDTAPILGASETNVLSQMTGQGVVVVEEERTTHGQLERALSLLNPEMAVGLVLNKSKKSRKDYYGYYYASSH